MTSEIGVLCAKCQKHPADEDHGQLCSECLFELHSEVQEQDRIDKDRDQLIFWYGD
jgi:predicted amidophosphoribosyltransferase